MIGFLDFVSLLSCFILGLFYWWQNLVVEEKGYNGSDFLRVLLQCQKRFVAVFCCVEALWCRREGGKKTQTCAGVVEPVAPLAKAALWCVRFRYYVMSHAVLPPPRSRLGEPSAFCSRQGASLSARLLVEVLR